MRHHLTYSGPGCPVEACTGVIAGKWKGEILHWLLEGSKRQGDLLRFIPGASRQELADQLRELETAGIIKSRVLKGMPRRVELSLTAEGKALKPVIKAAWQWGRSFLISHEAASNTNRSVEEPSASSGARRLHFPSRKSHEQMTEF